MNFTVRPARSLSGELTAPASKAQTHRALISGLLSEGTTSITNPLSCDDTEATANAISAFGAKLKGNGVAWEISGTGCPTTPASDIFCGESGVTLRFTIPIAGLTGSAVTIKAKPALLRRPLTPLVQAMEALGVRIRTDAERVIVEGGPAKGGAVEMRGDVSSQFVSGLLLAGPLMVNGLNLEMNSPLESQTYVTLTIQMMKQHGVRVQTSSEGSYFHVEPQKYRPAAHRIGGDFSSAAFILSAAAITDSKISVRGLEQHQSEPDIVIVDILREMGASISAKGDTVCAEGASLNGTRVDIRNNPDLAPAIAVLGCYATGETRITGASRLRYKESDRLAAIHSELERLGADITREEGGLIIRGVPNLRGGTVSSHGDHRIAMALSIAALRAANQVTIQGAECVSKSYPNFYKDLASLGVEILE